MVSTNNLLGIEQFSALVAALYRGPFQEKKWQDFLQQLRVPFDGCIAVIGFRLPKTEDAGVAYVAGAEILPINHQEYARRFSALDPLVNLPDGEIVSLDDMIPRQELKQTTYYKNFMQPFHQEQVMGFDIHRNDKVAVFIRLIREHGKADFSQQEKTTLKLLLPHCRELVNWMDCSRSYLREQSLFEQAFSTLAMATIVLDSKSKIVHKNQIAARLLNEDNGILCTANTLRLSSHQENQLFQNTLEKLLHGTKNIVPHSIVISRRAQPYPLLMTIKNIPFKDEIENERHVAIYIIAPEMRHFDQTQLVIDAFGLTQQEARLVMALINGKTLDDFASEMGISKNTARSHCCPIV